MFRSLLVVLACASASAFVAPGVQANVQMRGSPVMMAKRSGKVNPALFANGIDKKKIEAVKKAKAQALAQEKADDAKGLPKWNLFRVLPKQEKKQTRTTDGSYVFNKPWGKQWGA